ncbi:MAG: tetratricopeptide repeat protein [Blastocatellia bacterium]
MLLSKRKTLPLINALLTLGLLTLSLSAVWAQPAKRRAATPSAAFEQLVQRATAARQADKLDEAVRLYQQGLKQKPTWVEGWWALGTIYYQLDRYTEGRAAFQRLVVLEPKSGVGWAFLGLCEYQCREYPNALAHLQRARELGLGASEEIAAVARYHAAILLNKFEQFELAFAVLTEIAKTQKESPALIEAFGLTMLRMAYLPAEIPADKREIVIKTGRAAWLGAADQRPAAQQEYSELLAAFPRTPNVHYAYGVFLLRDAPDEAMQEFKKEIEISPDHIFARLQIAFEAIKRNDHAAGLPYAEEAVKRAPNLFAAHNALGRILLETGQTERAIRELEIGVKQAPDSPEMYFALARAYSKAGRKAEADRARAEFMRLDKIRRAGKENMVGDKPEAKP